MDSVFMKSTDEFGVFRDVRAWIANSDKSCIYSMEEIVKQIYGRAIDIGSDEFWRVAPHVGMALRMNGYKQFMRKNKRWWVAC